MARAGGDNLTWLLSAYLAVDSQRRGKWSRAVADLAVAQRPGNRAVLGKWIDRWAARADDAAQGLGQLLETLPEHGVAASDVAAHARAAREQFLAGLLEPAEPATQAG